MNRITISELNDLIGMLKSQNIPRSIIKELINNKNGAFQINVNSKYVPSRNWKFSSYLHFYKKSLKIWSSMQ